MTAQVSWPKAIKGTHVQRNIEKMFAAADNPSKEGSLAFAECFAPDGELVARGHVCKNHQDIVNFRQGAWDEITYRKHEVLKVFASDANDKDVAVIGRVVFGHKNGEQVVEGYAGNFIFDDQGLIKNYQAWVDTKAMTDMIVAARSRA